ncbi:helix-hairpin-helix domain-containing protein [Cobetia marina]|jgi:competence protein ComEA|uniref:ComEA family DNA-binding protein n=1 Tax=Cobetia TaxID=204286 RepID=UPI0009FEBDB4|nr:MULTISPECIES: helix-hairpin-helix domain-containing protein [Cobetia]MDH2290624.1 helix-hairpin-helix domain-containing protein [Cobetia sp. 10Alg 146]TKD64655.1 helix-hairpin-helix domain-containing protein [Cobetia marina]
MKTLMGSLVVAGLMAFTPLTQAAEMNINTATPEQLTQLKGIGDKKAQAIVAWRKANGPFTSVDQLAEVKGISANTLERMETTLTLDKTGNSAITTGQPVSDKAAPKVKTSGEATPREITSNQS